MREERQKPSHATSKGEATVMFLMLPPLSNHLSLARFVEQKNPIPSL
jgi:hypothetical protein